MAVSYVPATCCWQSCFSLRHGTWQSAQTALRAASFCPHPVLRLPTHTHLPYLHFAAHDAQAHQTQLMHINPFKAISCPSVPLPYSQLLEVALGLKMSTAGSEREGPSGKAGNGQGAAGKGVVEESSDEEATSRPAPAKPKVCSLVGL